jgi:hypothetical protein
MFAKSIKSCLLLHWSGYLGASEIYGTTFMHDTKPQVDHFQKEMGQVTVWNVICSLEDHLGSTELYQSKSMTSQQNKQHIYNLKMNKHTPKRGKINKPNISFSPTSVISKHNMRQVN